MTLLPAVIPDIPETRAGIVPARLARKLGPLFGIRWDGNGYGLTWVSDYSRLTLTEIARGALGPTRAEAAVETSVAPGSWQLVDRAVVSHRRSGAHKPEPLPNEIANATLNRFGPDTKAAVVLTAANTLLAPVTAAIVESLEFLHRTPVSQLPARLRVGAWAALVLEVFRSQPALFAAAVQARAVQRAALSGWELPTMRERSCARSEIGGTTSRPIDGASHPVDFAVVDATIEAIALDGVGTARAAERLGTASQQELRAELIHRWLARLVALGTVPGEGFLWLTEPEPGHRMVEAFAPHDPTLWRFLTEIENLLPADTDPVFGRAGIGSVTFMSAMPTLPRPAELTGMSALTRRATLLALTTLVRLAFNSGSPDIAGGLHTMATLDQLADLARAALPAADPVRAVTCCRVADMQLELVRQDTARDADLGPAVDLLLTELANCVELAGARVLNNSDAAELVRSGCVELMTLLRRHTEDRPLAGVPAPDALRARLDELWDTMLRSMQIDLGRLADQPTVIQRLIGYQLHDYATYRGGVGTEADAEVAVRLYRDFVIPAREDYYHSTGYFQPLLYSYQNATRATGRLALRAAEAGDDAAARQHAELGRRWIQAALTAPYTVEMLHRAAAQATDEACRFALLAVPALLTAAEFAPSADTAAELAECDRLLELGTRYAEGFGKFEGQYSRQAELVELAQWLKRIRAEAAEAVRHR